MVVEFHSMPRRSTPEYLIYTIKDRWFIGKISTKYQEQIIKKKKNSLK